MDAALALGPVRIECNVCGNYHNVVSTISAASVPVGLKEWEDVRWLDCLAQRCALGLHWSQKNTSAAMLRNWVETLNERYCAEEGRRKAISFVYETCSEVFAGFTFHEVRSAIRAILVSEPYEYMFVSNDDVSSLKGYVFDGLRRSSFPVCSPWMLATDSRMANRFMANRRVETLLANDAWSAVLAGARGFITAMPCACAASCWEDDSLVVSPDRAERAWKAYAASSTVAALYAQLQTEHTGLFLGEGDRFAQA